MHLIEQLFSIIKENIAIFKLITSESNLKLSSSFDILIGNEFNKRNHLCIKLIETLIPVPGKVTRYEARRTFSGAPLETSISSVR